MSTDTYRARVLSCEGATLTLRFEPLDDARAVAESRTFWLAVLAEGITRLELESPIAEQHDPYELHEDVDSGTEDEARARRFVASVSFRGDVAQDGPDHLRMAGPSVDVELQLTEPRWADGFEPGTEWRGLAWDGALDGPSASAAEALPEEQTIDDPPTLRIDRALAVDASLAGRDPASLSASHARAWLLAAWLRRPGAADAGIGLHVHGLTHLLHDLGPRGIGPALTTLRELCHAFPQLGQAVRAAEAFDAALGAAPAPERDAFFAARVGTPSPLAEQAYRSCMAAAGSAWSVYPIDDLLEAAFGLGSPLVTELVGHDVRPTYRTSMYLEQRIDRAPGPWLRETGLAGKGPLHWLLGHEGHEGTLRLVEAAVGQGADLGARDHLGETPLLTMLHTAGPNRLGQGEKRYALADAVQRLVALGADVTARRNDGRGAVALAVARQAHDPALLAALAALGAPFDALAVDGRTALFDAGTKEAVEDLLTRGCRVEHRALDGHTALVHVVSDGRAMVALALLEAGADARVPARWGGTLLAATMASWDLALALKRKTGDFPRLVKALVDAGLPLDVEACAGVRTGHAKIDKALAKVKLRLPAAVLEADR